jgi:hypothetical protein
MRTEQELAVAGKDAALLSVGPNQGCTENIATRRPETIVSCRLSYNSAVTRRELLLGAVAGFLPARAASAVPVHAISRGPLYHWFGYYDKLQFDPDSRYALEIANDFQHRLQTESDSVYIGMVDLKNNDRWIELGRSYAWSWHQGCMLQWLPGSRTDVIWNERQGDRFVSRMLNVKTRSSKVIPFAIYCVSPDARWALANDFARSFSMRPETGYAGGHDRYATELTPADSGIWRVDLQTGKRDLLISLADAVKYPLTRGDWTGAKHYFDHLLISPDGQRFSVLQRWGHKTGEFATRWFTADANGKNIRVLDDSGRSSHYIWRDPEHILIYTAHASGGERFYLVNERTGTYEAVPGMEKNGHVTYLPGNRWILSDTAPDRERLQHVYIFDTQTQHKVEIGAYYSPPEFKGVWRCDTTPRHNASGALITFDSPHAGEGRQTYLADISGLIL